MRILVIDPNPLFLQAARNYIGALPQCECLTAATLQEGFALQAARQAELVLVDYALRHQGGENRVRGLKALAPAARLVLLAEDATAYRNSSLAAGADDCATKNALGSELARLLAPQTRRACA
jgi:DNA-binding NarL/FixJ family response regulator